MSSMSRPSPTLAARCATASQPARAVRTRSRSRTSSAGSTARSKTTGSWPASASRRRTWRPMKPSPPVSRTLTPRPPSRPGPGGRPGRGTDELGLPALLVLDQPGVGDPEARGGRDDLERVVAEHRPGEPAAGAALPDQPGGRDLQALAGRCDVDEHGAAGQQQVAAAPEQADGVAADADVPVDEQDVLPAPPAAEGEDVAVERGGAARARHGHGRRRDVHAQGRDPARRQRRRHPPGSAADVERRPGAAGQQPQVAGPGVRGPARHRQLPHLTAPRVQLGAALGEARLEERLRPPSRGHRRTSAEHARERGEPAVRAAARDEHHVAGLVDVGQRPAPRRPAGPRPPGPVG